MPILNPGPQQIAYALSGPADAPVIVLSNSLGTTMAMWDAQVEVLARDFRVLRYDTRGHGDSGLGDSPATGYTLEQLGGDVLRLLDALDIGRAHFCGISMGGLTGLWLGVHAGQRLLSLTVANSAPCIGTATGWRDRAGQVAATGMGPIADGAPTRWFSAAFVQRSPSVVAGLIDGLRHSPPDGYAACCMALAKADLRARIGAIAVPTLLLAGRFDPVTTVDDAQFMRARIKDARLEVLDASHLSNVEAAQDFTARLHEFVR